MPSVMCTAVCMLTRILSDRPRMFMRMHTACKWDHAFASTQEKVMRALAVLVREHSGVSDERNFFTHSSTCITDILYTAVSNKCVCMYDCIYVYVCMTACMYVAYVYTRNNIAFYLSTRPA